MGQHSPGFGEGTYTNCQLDASSNNIVIGNTVLGTIPDYGFNVKTDAQTLRNDTFADNTATTATLGISDVALLPVTNEARYGSPIKAKPLYSPGKVRANASLPSSFIGVPVS